MHYPLHDGLTGRSLPVGSVQLPDEIEGRAIEDAYILPLLRNTGDGKLEIVSFALVQNPAVPAEPTT